MLKKISTIALALTVLFGLAVEPESIFVADGQVVSASCHMQEADNSGIHLAVAKNVDKRVLDVSLGGGSGWSYEGNSGAVTKDGNLYMWGANDQGQLGDGTEKHRDKPVKVLENVRTVNLGYGYSGAVTEDGSLYMWGANDDGQLGDGTKENRNKPVKVLEHVKTVSLGYWHSGAVTSDGDLYIWGRDGLAQLEYHESEKDYSRPFKVMGNVKWVSFGGRWHTGAITKDGDLYMWGDNSSGQLGDGTKKDRKKPVKVLENVQAVSLGGEHVNVGGTYGYFIAHSGAVTEDGSLYMWGCNDDGQLGDGTEKSRTRPVKVLENVRLLSLGGRHSGAVTDDGILYMWGGDNEVGQLGDGTTIERKIPVKISFFSNAKFSQKISYRSSAIEKGKVAYGSSFSLNAKTTGTGKLTYKSSNTKILSVNAKGRVTVKGYGPAYIQIKAAGGNGYKAAVRKIKLIAVPKQGKITKAEWQKSGVRIQWKPEKTADGYEYAIAYNKKFSSQSRKKTKKTGLILTKYKTGTKKMYVKVRTYKKAGKKTYYGSWSKVRALKLKKARKTGESSYAIAN